MARIMEEISEWLPTLWDVGVEDEREVDLVREFLVLYSRAVQSAKCCGSL